MAAFWWVDAAGARQGPLEEAEFVTLIGAGSVRRETLVWADGMAQWAAAGEVPALSSAFAGQPPATPSQQPHGWPSPPQAAAHPAAESGDRLSSVAEVWPLFGRFLLNVVGSIFVIPLPWTAAYANKYLAETTVLPDGRRFAFEGRAGDIWWAFIGMSLLGLFGQTKYGMVWASLASLALGWFVLRWFVDKIHLGAGPGQFRFQGEVWVFAGWVLLYAVSIFTIIGWAWAFKYMLSWMCRNVAGPLSFDVKAPGWEFLWRFTAGGLACLFVIPISWALAWLIRWTVSTIEVRPAQTA